MKNQRITLPVCWFIVCLTCQPGLTQPRSIDLRERLLHSAQRADKAFPNGQDVVLTHFAYLGKVQTRDGVVYVVNQRAVLNNMPAPRGVNAVVFFNARLQWLGKLAYASNQPLWCERGKVYLFGDLDVPSDKGEGNVLDLSQGYRRLRIYHEKRYGSSGGTLDGGAGN